MSIGVPIKLLHEAQGHIITLELKTGQLYRGKLLEDVPMFKRAIPGAMKGRGLGLGRGTTMIRGGRGGRGGGFRGGRGRAGPPSRGGF
ncbi:unnamed protein product [Absidia cylindrospora]